MRFSNLTGDHSKAISFTIDDIDVAIVNAIRRTVLSEIPNVAFPFNVNTKNKSVDIKINTCSLHNEFLGHRLSLVPLCFSLDEIKSGEPMKYKYVLHKHNTSNQMMDVTSEDIEIFDASGAKMPKDFRDRIFPCDPITKDYILITKLKPNLYSPEKGDEVHIEAKTNIGIAKEHACYSPVSVCTFYNNGDPEKQEKAREHIKSQFADADAAVAHFNLLEADRHFKTNKYGEPCSFTFQVESECAMTPKDIVSEGIRVLISKIEELAKHFDDQDVVSMTLQNGIIYLNLKKEDHTLGNLLQALLYNNFVRDEEQKVMDYVGYFKPHPLEDGIVMKVKMSDMNGDDDSPSLVQCIQKTSADLKVLLDEWERFA